MSDLLKLAHQLRESDDACLSELLKRRNAQAQYADFFDLAEALLNPKSIDLILAKLTLSEVGCLEQLIAARGAVEKTVELENFARKTALAAVRDQQVELFEVAAVASKPLINSLNAITTVLHAVAEHKADPERDCQLAAIAAFETQQAITELILDLEQHFVRVVGKTGVGLPDIKRLAAHLRKPNDDARSYYQMAESAHLVAISHGRWWLTEHAQQWLHLAPAERWLLLTQDWLARLGRNSCDELSKSLHSQGSQTFEQLLARVFPLADFGLKSHLHKVADEAELLGLSVASRASTLATQVLNGDFETAKSAMLKYMPAPKKTLIAQADQTLIAPGPLPTETEILLRRFAEVEQVSVASTYRITALSLSHGLETGLTEIEIRSTLESLTAKALPQPIDYAINQSVQRFGKLSIRDSNSPERSIISATDGVLLTQILNDVQLRPFALKPHSAASLSSRFEPEVLYFGLREHGYLPVRVDSAGKVMSPKVSISWNSSQEAKSASSAIDLVISKLRSADQRVGERPSDDDLLRQIQLAIKNKSQMRVHLKMRDGSDASFSIKPTSIANGRLRGLDIKADAERTLPVAQITRVEF